MLLMPLVPHLANECCEIINKKVYWPKFNADLLKEENCNIVIQVNGRKRGMFEMPMDSDENLVIKKAKDLPSVNKTLNDKEVIKIIYIPGKILNIVIK